MNDGGFRGALSELSNVALFGLIGFLAWIKAIDATLIGPLLAIYATGRWSVKQANSSNQAIVAASAVGSAGASAPRMAAVREPPFGGGGGGGNVHERETAQIPAQRGRVAPQPTPGHHSAVNPERSDRFNPGDRGPGPEGGGRNYRLGDLADWWRRRTGDGHAALARRWMEIWPIMAVLAVLAIYAVSHAVIPGWFGPH